MKIVLLLLPVYLIFLSCLPCRDGDEESVAIAVISRADHTVHHHTEESCAPFCTCTCCGISSASGPFYSGENITAVFTTQPVFTITAAPFLPRQYLQTIWQPPRLS